MSDLNELRNRKEQLLLEQEVARLERKQELSKSGNWSWLWVAPLALIGLALLIGGLNDGNVATVALSPFALAPVALKLYFRR